MKIKTGILLAGGTGSRLLPLTAAINKHLLPVHDKFIIDYSIDTLINLGCEFITVILGGSHYEQVIKHLRDGFDKKIEINYVYQHKPIGIAQAINLCKRYVDDEFVICLGDNIFDGSLNFKEDAGAKILLADHPQLFKYGVASIQNEKIVNIVEKPTTLNNSYENYAITGCYVFNKDYFKYFKHLKPSARGEFEITDIIRYYLADGQLSYGMFEGMWSDAGTPDTLQYTQNYFYNKGKK